MKAKDLLRLGFNEGPAVGAALSAINKFSIEDELATVELLRVLADPDAHLQHKWFAEVSRALQKAKPAIMIERAEPAPFEVWGEGIEKGALDQMKNAARLPVAVRGALMPDAHQGYGLPIGGVLAVENAVIPYAVGVDIACRMKLTVLDIDVTQFERLRGELSNVLERETIFGTGGAHKRPLSHDVLDEDWLVSPITRQNFEKARAQLGTSGSGNHFVEFGIIELTKPDLDLAAGKYVALLSHSGSRGTGAAVANYYSQRAREICKGLPKELTYLAWLDMHRAEGQEYFAAMNLMGKYAAANHDLIHKRVAKAAGARVIAGVENHHNFAWLEEHDGKQTYVHRKGATPAGVGVLGVIPGSMATPGFVVRGKGHAPSLNSASHGAGRAMSRTKAKESFNWPGVKPMLESVGVTLLSAGIDESPHSYKDIHSVMKAQSDLVEVIARFDPKIVKMAKEGEQPED